MEDRICLKRIAQRVLVAVRGSQSGHHKVKGLRKLVSEGPAVCDCSELMCLWQLRLESKVTYG